MRPVDSPGRLGWGQVGRRVLLSTAGTAGDALRLVPVVGGLGVLLTLWPWVDKLAAFGTPRQQSLHDLWAGTQVVARRPAPLEPWGRRAR